MKSSLYRAKIGLEFVIPIAAILSFVAWQLLFNGLGFWGLLLVLPPIFIVIYVFKNTYYVIEGECLLIKSGLFYNQKINILGIKTIKKTRNPISSPALTINRLEITYGKYNSVLIAPKERDLFLAEIKAINPQIICFV